MPLTLQQLKEEVHRQQAERARLMNDVAEARKQVCRLRVELDSQYAEIQEVRDLLHTLLTFRSLEKQTLPDVLYAVEYYIGGITESRLERQIRSENMIKTSLALREVMRILLGEENIGEEV